MTVVGWLPAPVEDLFGTEATAEESYEVLTVDVPPAAWLPALETARDRLSCTYFDWLSAVDEPGTGFRVAAHVVALSPVRRLLLRTTVPHEAPALPSAVGVFAGAAWHERETHEMFGVVFEDHPALDHLLLPEGFEGHPLRKDFVLAARVAKAWPGAKEPGESTAGAAHGGPKRRQMLPPGVPDPNEWGPLKGQLPPAPTRPTRGAGRAGAGTGATARERPVRRTRTASEGSASQTSVARSAGASGPETPLPEASSAQAATSPSDLAPTEEPTAKAPVARRRARTTSEGSASQGSASQRGDSGTAVSGVGEASDGGAAPVGDQDGTAAPAQAEDISPKRPAAPRGSDAPWHHARPAFDEPERDPEPEPDPAPEPERQQEPAPGPDSEPKQDPAPEPEQAPEPDQRAESDTRAGSAPAPDDPQGGPQ